MLQLQVQEIQYDISSKCNQIKLYSDDVKVLDVFDYDNFVNLKLLKKIVKRYNSENREG